MSVASVLCAADSFTRSLLALQENVERVSDLITQVIDLIDNIELAAQFLSNCGFPTRRVSVRKHAAVVRALCPQNHASPSARLSARLFFGDRAELAGEILQ